MMGLPMLLARMLEGDDGAEAALVAELTPVVRRRVMQVLARDKGRWGRDLSPEADDLTQDVLLALFARDACALRAWVPERGLPLERFVGLLARRHALSIVRSRRRNPFSAQPTDPSDFDQQPPASERRDAHRVSETRQALERLLVALTQSLCPTGLELLQRLFVQEQSVRDISDHTGLSADCVYQWRCRIRQRARHLQQSEPDGAGPARRVARCRQSWPKRPVRGPDQLLEQAPQLRIHESADATQTAPVTARRNHAPSYKGETDEDESSPHPPRAPELRQPELGHRRSHLPV